MKRFKTQYRIITNVHVAYTVEFKKWYLPFWCELFWVNIKWDIEDAFDLINISENTGSCFKDPRPKFKSSVVFIKKP